MFKQFRTAVVAAAAGLAAAGAAQALTVQVYTDQASFQAAAASLGSLISTDFSSPTGLNAGSAYLPLVEFNTYAQLADGPIQVSDNIFTSVDGALTDAGTAATATNPFGVGSVGGVIGGGTLAMSWDFLSAANAPALIFSTGTEFAFTASPTASGFVGIIADKPILFFLFANGRFADTGTPDRYFIDNFTILSPVPEPATYAMFLAGVAAIGAAARRRS